MSIAVCMMMISGFGFSRSKGKVFASENLDESGELDVKSPDSSELLAALQPEYICWNEGWTYADHSAIHTDQAVLFHADPSVSKGYTVCVNAGHGTASGESAQTMCHPDGTPKVTGGSTQAGATMAAAISSGTTMLDGTPEAAVTLQLALILRDRLLAEGYDVLMPRTSEDAQFDNIARAVLANELADCHISLHYDSTESDKGLYYTSVPEIESYRNMEPVASHWQEHEQLGKCIIQGAMEAGISVFEGGSMPVDLTQTSYSTVPSIDLEVGDRASDWSETTHAMLAEGITAGLNLFFRETAEEASPNAGADEDHVTDPDLIGLRLAYPPGAFVISEADANVFFRGHEDQETKSLSRVNFTSDQIRALMEQFPDADVIAAPIGEIWGNGMTIGFVNVHPDYWLLAEQPFIELIEGNDPIFLGGILKNMGVSSLDEVEIYQNEEGAFLYQEQVDGEGLGFCQYITMFKTTLVEVYSETHISDSDPLRNMDTVRQLAKTLADSLHSESYLDALAEKHSQHAS